MVQSPSWKANIHPAIQEIPPSPHFMKPYISLSCSQEPATCPILSQMNPNSNNGVFITFLCKVLITIFLT
jgi:hypothetical protein